VVLGPRYGASNCLSAYCYERDAELSEIVEGLMRTTVELVSLLGFPTLRSRGDLPAAGLQGREDWLTPSFFSLFSMVPMVSHSALQPKIAAQECLFRYLTAFRRRWRLPACQYCHVYCHIARGLIVTSGTASSFLVKILLAAWCRRDRQLTPISLNGGG
jgi:hypothetical protein